jgi:hypothetical protein
VSQVGAPVRIVALIGLLAALGAGAWTFTAGRSATNEPASVGNDAVAANPVAAAQSVAGKLSTHNNATAAGHATPAAAKPAAKAAATKPAAAAKPKPLAKQPAVQKTAAPGETPTTIASLLARYESVVVLLYDPRTSVDDYSVAETALGAKNAHAGFLRVDVMNQRQAAPFTQAYGVLQDPTVLFYARPGKLVQKLFGFADHDTVAQAAHNAALGFGASAPMSAAAAPTG